MNKKTTTNMTMKLINTLLIAGALTFPGVRVSAQSEEDALKLVRSTVNADRKTVVTEGLQLTAQESEKFWPLYQEYRVEMDKVGDGLVKLVKEYATLYPNVPDANAKPMLKNLIDLQTQRAATRAKYLNKTAKVLPAGKNLRFAQIENRLDLLLQLQLAAQIPLTPVEGSLGVQGATAATFEKGVPGGTAVRTVRLEAVVVAIDKSLRKVTLMDSDGIKQTVKVGKEAVNFDQIKVGDRLKVVATEELIVRMSKPGEKVEDDAGLVALAPQGAKPGGVVAESVTQIGTIIKIDTENRTATLRFEDGTTHTLPVRADVDLSQKAVGEKVVLRATQMIALSVEKP